jgi:hypothetical protein
MRVFKAAGGVGETADDEIIGDLENLFFAVPNSSLGTPFFCESDRLLHRVLMRLDYAIVSFP